MFQSFPDTKNASTFTESHSIFDRPTTPENKTKDLNDSPKSAQDSGIGDSFDSPTSHEDAQARDQLDEDRTTPNTPAGRATTNARKAFVEDEDEEDSFATEKGIIPEDLEARALGQNPFDNAQSRILFNAIDRLQSFGSSKFLQIPQLVIVGGQSSGKSSLLQSLTGIPFPVGHGCCTRFPIRVLSRRTPPSSEETFRITVEEPEVSVEGLLPADSEARDFESSGSILTAEKFSQVLEDLSNNHMGIRKGRGNDKKNFVPDIVKVELSGPNRAPFSILDLPGLVSSPHSINREEMRGIRQMTIEYMKRKENVIVCVVTAAVDLATQETYNLAIETVSDQDRLLGAFTNCDRPLSIDETVSHAMGQQDEGSRTLKHGFFVVRNKLETEDPNFDLSASENDLFGVAPWTSIRSSRRGTAMLKSHLANVLSSRIVEEFPKLERSINDQLSERRADQARLGESRDTHHTKQCYINHHIQAFNEKAILALTRPGNLESEAVELRQKIRTLNDDFDQIMRLSGHSWQFEDSKTEPLKRLQAYAAVLDSDCSEDEMRAQGQESLETRTFDPSFIANGLKQIPGFDQHKQVKPTTDFWSEIEKQLSGFQASQPPGVVNSDVYPVIYRLQVQKWSAIAKEHLEHAEDAIRRCFHGILESVCPSIGGTAILHEELASRLDRMFANTCEDAFSRTMEYCTQESNRKLLQTTNPAFEQQLGHWRALRYMRNNLRYEIGQKAEPSAPRSAQLDMMYRLLSSHGHHQMRTDVHDVVRVYYDISMEAFIRHVTQTITESFVMNREGPLCGLTTEYVLGLSEEEVEEMAREDDQTLRRRRAIKADIDRLLAAQKTAHDARREMNRVALI